MIVRQTSRTLPRSGFTLMEMLVVVAIIVALAGIGGYFLLGTLQTSQEDIARLKARKLAEACEQFYLRTKQYPQDWDNLYQINPPILKEKNGHLDPWGQEYKKEMSPAGVVVYTMGPNGVISSND
jgi:general secretion pathway protein G